MNPLTSPYHEAVVIVVLVCLDEPGKDHNLATLAAQAGYSPFHFHRIFRAMTGESPSAFLRRIRLEWSAKQLIEGTSVSKVAAESGFGSLDSFTRAFRLAYGERPSAFRRSPCHILLACPNGVHYGHPFTIDFQTYRGRQMNIRIEQSQELHVIGMRHIGPYPTIGSTFGKLMGWVAQNPTEFIGSVATFLDDPEQVPAEDLRSDAYGRLAELALRRNAPDEARALADTGLRDTQRESVLRGRLLRVRGQCFGALADRDHAAGDETSAARDRAEAIRTLEESIAMNLRIVRRLTQPGAR